MNYGYFDEDKREYVITRPDTPRPWSNYVGNSEFGGLITNHGTGYTFYRSAAMGRLTRFQFNDAPADWHGRHVYLRAPDTGTYWSNGWMPVRKPVEDFEYECRHGSGYTSIRSTYEGIQSEVTTFVPLGARFEVWRIRVSNPGEQAREVQVFPFIEPQCNWSADDDNRNLQYIQYITQTRHCGNLIDIGSNINMPEDLENFTNKDQKRHIFFGLAGIDAAECDSDLTTFLGPYGSRAAPDALRKGCCSGSTASGDMPCAAFEIAMHLEAGESKTFAVVFGVGSVEKEGQEAVEQMDSPDKIQTSLDAQMAYWSERLDTLSAETPDPAFNAMMNMWAPFNNLMTFYWSRTASLVYAGERDGLGYRDTMQDFVGSAALIPEETRQRLELLITGQFASGGCKPVVQPFHHHPGHEIENEDILRADDALWMFMAVPGYVKETGDLNFFQKVLPYADAGKGTVLDHLRRAITFSLDHSGTHSLPCGLHADWNDCIRLGRKGESVFVAFQLRYALREYIQIADLLQQAEEKAWANEQLHLLDENLRRHAWDGEWYLRAYREDGLKFGSRENAEGRIFMNPQSWAILSGHAQGERAQAVLDAMDWYLSTDSGIMLCTPPYSSTDPEICLARLFNPGMKENGAVFNHTQGWAVMAAAQLGLGERAWKYLKNVMPASYNDRAEVRQVEPYAVCQSTHSQFSARCGAGRVSWLSGSAVWNYVAMSHAILGIQPDYEGLRIDPCIPALWKEFSVTRKFRGTTYLITIKNPNGVNKGVKQIVVDGVNQKSNLLPLRPTGGKKHVVVTLGSLEDRGVPIKRSQ